MNNQQTSSRIPFSLIARIVLLFLGVVFYALGALAMLGLGIFSSVSPELVNPQEAIALFSIASTLIVIVLLTTPGLILNFIQLFQSPSEQPATSKDKSMILPNLLLIGWLFFMAGAYFLAQNELLGEWLLPVFQVPAVLIPIFWLYRFSTRKQTRRNTGRNWTVLGLNLSLQPLIIVILELFLMAFIFVFAVIWIAQDPELVQSLTTDYEQLIATNLDPDTLNRIIEPYVNLPMVQFTIFFFIAGLVPVIEELIKPFLVWWWIKRPLSAGEGFLLGLIGGSAFTLWENFNALSGATTGTWFFVVVARYGTSIIHMSTSALLGWALMKTFSDRKYWRAGLAYFAVISIHGLWNFATMLEAMAELPINQQQFPMQLTPVAPFILVALLLVGLTILIGGSFTLFSKEKISTPAMQDTSTVTSQPETDVPDQTH